MKNFRAKDMKKGAGKGDSTAEQPAESQQAEQPQQAAQAEQPQQPAQPEQAQPQASEEDEDEDVPAGTTAEILQWVGNDKGRAQKALDAEQSHSSPRAGLTGELNKILSA